MDDRPAQRGAYMPQLDGLRAAALLAVMASHYLPGVVDLPLGGWGVRLFFVLSGFLITGLLLEARERLPATGLGGAVAEFYFRRALRIMPAYYLVLAAAAAAGSDPGTGSWLWHTLYATNLYVADTLVWPGPYAPFWSLAVEQQFYLVWPFVVLLTPARRLGPLLAASIVAGLAYRLGCVAAGFDATSFGVLPFNALDAFAAGGLVALRRRAGARVPRDAAAATLPLVALAAGLRAGFDFGHWPAIAETAETLCFAALVAWAAEGLTGLGGAALGSPALRWIGRISYGAYLNHFFMPEALAAALAAAGLALPAAPCLRFAMLAAASLLAASLSWWAIERPIAQMKSRRRVLAPAAAHSRRLVDGYRPTLNSR